MYDLPEKSIYITNKNPLFEKVSFSQLSTKDIYKEYEKFKKDYGTSSPEKDALLFYLSNHGYHLVKSKYQDFENLDEKTAKFLQMHIKNTNEISKRLFFYIILISIEESYYMPEQKPHFYDYMASSFGQDFVDFMKKKSDLNFSKIDMPIGKFLQGLRGYFDFVKWPGGFGGRAWGNIVGIAQSAVVGRQSFEMMTDYAFTLCHNNGSMFNKRKLYDMYTSFIYDILDIQASGQIPNWIGENLKSSHLKKETVEVYKLLKEMFPQEISAPVDKAKLNSMAKVRRENHEKLMKQLKNATPAWGQNTNNNNNDDNTPKVKPKAIDTMLISDFKKNKWI